MKDVERGAKSVERKKWIVIGASRVIGLRRHWPYGRY